MSTFNFLNVSNLLLDMDRMITKETTIKELIGMEGQVKDLLDRYAFTNHEATLEIFEQEGVEPAFFVELMDLFVAGEDFDVQNLKVFSLPRILDYLKQTHVYYLEEKLPEMEKLTYQMVDAVGKSESEIIYFFYLKFSTELKKHIEFEEMQVFPYIQRMLDGEKPEFTRNAFRLSRFVQNHTGDLEQELNDFLVHLTTNFSKLKDEEVFKQFCKLLADFEKDLLRHAVIEDDLLMVEALEIELELLK